MRDQKTTSPLGLNFNRPSHEQIYFTKAEAANYTRHSLRTLDYAVENGELRAFKPSKKLLFLKSDLDTWIQRRCAGADLDKLIDEVVAEVSGTHSK